MSSAQTVKGPVPAHVPPELVFDFDVYNPPGADVDFHGALKRLHDEHYPDIFWSTANGGHWVATRGEDIHKIFADYQNFSSHKLTVPASSAPPIPLYPIFADPPQHGLYRALLNPSFSPKAVATLEARARALAVKLVEDLKPRGGCDFVVDFAQHLPIEVFMSIVDVPAADRHDLLEWAEGMVRPKKPDDVHVTIQKIFAYAAAKIAARRAQPGDDLISKFTRAEVNGRPLTDQEITGMVSLVLIGGMDTVVTAMSFAALFLARSPAHRKQLADNPALIPKAVDELLRRFPIVNQGRCVARDLVYKNIPFKAGDMILLPTTLHGLDERAFPNPLEVDFNRPTPIHSTFGNGPHRCPGSNLGRTEIKVFLEEWLKRIPDFQLQPGQKISMRSGVNGTVYGLPLAWEAA
ncbi:MAG TPA: cytochrome P450 [Steroidobacteraceae bacterium]|nr:cytochrome P450 [Steroidobacteraceae bacterium]